MLIIVQLLSPCPHLLMGAICITALSKRLAPWTSWGRNLRGRCWHKRKTGGENSNEWRGLPAVKSPPPAAPYYYPTSIAIFTTRLCDRHKVRFGRFYIEGNDSEDVKKREDTSSAIVLNLKEWKRLRSNRPMKKRQMTSEWFGVKRQIANKISYYCLVLSEELITDEVDWHQASKMIIYNRTFYGRMIAQQDNTLYHFYFFFIVKLQA